MRITGGKASGIEFFSPRSMQTRPVLERSRISLFASIGKLDDKIILDLFAGSGAFGLEAASRGAAEAIFVENNPAAVKTISENIAKIQKAGVSSSFKIIKSDAEAFIRSNSDLSPDFIFIDPPYKSLDYFFRSFFNLSMFAKIAKHATIIVKTPEKFDVSPIQNSIYGELIRQRRFGGTDFCFVKIKAN